MSWVWDASVNNYRNENGQFLSREKARLFIDTSISASQNVTSALSEMVSNSLLSSFDWELIMREEIKREYIREYLLGIGGVNNMTQADWGRIGGMLKEQYSWLNNFSAEIAAGNLTEAQIRARAAMYMESARESYQRAEFQTLKDMAVSESWHTMPGAEHCADCIAFEAMGIQPIGTFPFPGQGDTQCLTNCKCEKKYYDAEGIPLND